jgi:hypothetical protein
MGKIFTLTTFLLSVLLVLQGQTLDNKHNPALDINLSPAHNNVINPERNNTINPKYNWNINPLKNGLINPEKLTTINPKNNLAMNPLENHDMNPMFSMYLSPRYDRWRGLYLFDKNDELIGFIKQYSQDIIIQFDRDANWAFFYVRTPKGTYNQFNLSADWTGCYLCSDAVAGYNLFNKEGNWTGIHIK